MNNKVSFSIRYILPAVMAVVFVHDFILALNKVEELPYSEFKKLVAGGKVAEVSVTNQVLTGKLKPEEESKEQKSFVAVRVEDPDRVRELNQHGVIFAGVIEPTFLRDLMSWSSRSPSLPVSGSSSFVEWVRLRVAQRYLFGMDAKNIQTTPFVGTVGKEKSRPEPDGKRTGRLS